VKSSPQPSVIGARIPMVDGVDKVTGTGKYADDLTLPGMLVGKILHSPHPHARIRSIDTSAAEALPGVKAVVTGRETPVKYGILPVGHDETIFAVDKVRYIGDNVAAVAAPSEAMAEDAVQLIRLDYETLPAYFDPEQSMRAEDNLIHEDRPHNIEREYHHQFGNVEEGFAAADYVREDRFDCAEVTHAALEPQSTLANFSPDGRLTVWSSTQVPYYLMKTLAFTLQMAEENVRVIKPLIGGGFGGKSEVIPLELAAAVLARKAGAPVKITYTREEVFYAHRGRPRQIVELKTGVTRQGKLTAVEARIIQDGGAYCGYGVVTILYSGQLLFAFEQQLNRIATVLGIDPVEIRRRNFLKAPCRTVNDLRVLSYGYPECIEQVADRSGWKQKYGRLPYGKGIGIAGSHYVSGAANPIIRSAMPHTTVNLTIDRDGTVTIFTGAAEIGQGSDTMQVQIVAAELGLPMEQVKIIAADTGRTPVDLGSYSSRVTFMAGNAALAAAREAKSQILTALAPKLAATPGNLVMENGNVYCRDDLRLVMSFRDAVRLAV